MGERGLNVVLIARQQAKLDEVAVSIRNATRVETRVARVDLSRPDAIETIIGVTSDLDVGMLIYTAGADPNYEPFLIQPVENALMMIERNCTTPTRMCHRFVRPMVERGKGGVILVSSGAGLVGFPNVVAYCGSKAFDIMMAEALWAEVRGQGVDVLALVLGFTDTPAQRRVMARHGLLAEDDYTTPIPGALTPEQVVAEALEQLPRGPTWITNPDLRQLAAGMSWLDRQAAVRSMINMAGGVMEEPAPA
jgi:short-subunit dehydrogenase